MTALSHTVDGLPFTRWFVYVHGQTNQVIQEHTIQRTFSHPAIVVVFKIKLISVYKKDVRKQSLYIAHTQFIKIYCRCYTSYICPTIATCHIESDDVSNNLAKVITVREEHFALSCLLYVISPPSCCMCIYFGVQHVMVSRHIQVFTQC